MNKFKIRVANLEDANELEQLMQAAYSIYDEILDGIVLPPMHADYNEEIADYPTWVMEYENHLAGGLIMYFDEKDACLSNIAVHPKYKGQGLGKILISFAETIAREKGYNSLSLATHIKLLNNIKYYKKLGFEEIDRDENKVYFTKILK
ncbi:hypothetical protein SH2C18_31850 [Clostridium sediminicola]|uniref:GNAT family N-acetyltransferase n=1 Tax=Clostridium sediminicola TaxID=3114879 RepID=UPI0031F1E32C